MVANLDLSQPLSFVPVYQTMVWGGQAIARWRAGVPEGPVGESWDLADAARGTSVVEHGPLRGTTLRDLTRAHGRELVGDGFAGGDFPLLIKLIDANDRLSVQVHPDDRLAVELGVGPRGKTECWLVLNDGGELFLGTKPGVDRAAFEAACSAGRVAETLNRFETRDGDFFFVPARTVHALGTGCLVYEIQQTCDVTFRVDDWGRVGLDGKPRALHVAESLATIDFEAKGSWPTPASEMPHRLGGAVRHLVRSDYFTVEERRASHTTTGGGDGRCSIVICVEGAGLLATAGGGCQMQPMRTYLVPAVAGAWTATADSTAPHSGLRLLVAQPAIEVPIASGSGSR